MFKYILLSISIVIFILTKILSLSDNLIRIVSYPVSPLINFFLVQLGISIYQEPSTFKTRATTVPFRNMDLLNPHLLITMVVTLIFCFLIGVLLDLLFKKRNNNLKLKSKKV